MNLKKYKLGELVEVTRGMSLSGQYYSETGTLIRLTLGNFNMNGGVFIGAGSNSSMTKSMSVTSTQPNMYVTSGSMISSATLIDIRINSTDVITFKPKYGAYKFLLSTPKMTKEASYTIYTGGSYSSATNTAGLYTGGTYTPGTSKKSGTLSSSGTVTSVSF